MVFYIFDMSFFSRKWARDFLFQWWCQQVLGGDENSPLMQPSLRGQKNSWTWCYVIRTQHHQPTMPGTEKIWTESQRVNAIIRLIVRFQPQAGSANGAVIFQWGVTNTDGGGDSRVTNGCLGVNFRSKCQPRYHKGYVQGMVQANVGHKVTPITLPYGYFLVLVYVQSRGLWIS